jgi:DNA-binding NarL/FixJ family response regulator
MSDAPPPPPPGPPLRVVLRAADPVRRAGLAALLRQAGHAVAEAAGEVLLADLEPGEALPAGGGMPVLLLSDAEEVRRDARPVAGLLPRAVAPAQLEAALRAVAAGLYVRLPGMVLPQPRGFAAAEEALPPPVLLTPREVEVLTLVGEGFSNKAVARRLGISAHTVKFHLESVFAKLGATSRAEAVARGLRGGAIEI